MCSLWWWGCSRRGLVVEVSFGWFLGGLCVRGIWGLLGCGFWPMWASISDLGVGYGVGGSVIENVGGW